jgi:hypothetical protein
VCVPPPTGERFEPRRGEAPDVQSVQIRSTRNCLTWMWHLRSRGRGVCCVAGASSVVRVQNCGQNKSLKTAAIRERRPMMFGLDFRRQAGVCVRLAEECDDHYLAARLRAMASDLSAIADDLEDPPRKQFKHEGQQLISDMRERLQARGATGSAIFVWSDSDRHHQARRSRQSRSRQSPDTAKVCGGATRFRLGKP